MKHRLEYVLFLALRWVVLQLPLRAVQGLARRLADLAFQLAASRRRIALDNLRHAFPPGEKTEEELYAIARGAFRNYATALLELLWFPRLTDETLQRLVSFKSLDLVREAHARNKGVILLTGHFGNWELIALAVGRLSGIPLKIIVQTQNNKLVDAVVNRHRTLLGNHVVPMGMAVREMLHALRRGEPIALASDQSAPREGIYVDFFGRRVATHQGPAVFALRTGAPILAGFIIRQRDGTYDIIFEEVGFEDIAEDTEEHVVALTERHTQLLERYIRRYPDQWLWMHRRWKNLEHETRALAAQSDAVSA